MVAHNNVTTYTTASTTCTTISAANLFVCLAVSFTGSGCSACRLATTAKLVRMVLL